MLREASYYSRMTLGIYRMTRAKLARNPRAVVTEMLARREENFLELMRSVVFANPANPYCTLFRWAGCTMGDLENAVLRDGLEATLEALRHQGVYLSHDEFKGKRPIERAGRQLAMTTADVANPNVLGLLETTSGGSRSGGTITRRSVEFQVYREAQTMLFCEDIGLMRRPVVGIRQLLPSDGGIRLAILFARRGIDYRRWFALAGTFRNAGHYRTVSKFLLAEARLMGVPVRFPEYLPHNDFAPVARALASYRTAETHPIFWGGVSGGVRVAAAALEHGIDISGTSFILGAEAITDAKRATVEAAGCKLFPRYAVSELGHVGFGCEGMTNGNIVHVCKDSLAVISYRKVAPLTDVTVNSLMFTTLMPWAPWVLVNVEMDDSATLEPAQCDCQLKSMGYTEQLSGIFSYGRLTGQGMTLVGSDMLRIIEEVLPARFGGSPTDYQFVECDGSEQTRLELRVHPRTRVRSAAEVEAFFLDELKKLYGGALTIRNWVQTGAVRAVIAEPYLSSKGRVHSLHLLGTTNEQRRGNSPARSEEGLS